MIELLPCLEIERHRLGMEISESCNLPNLEKTSHGSCRLCSVLHWGNCLYTELSHYYYGLWSCGAWKTMLVVCQSPMICGYKRQTLAPLGMSVTGVVMGWWINLHLEQYHIRTRCDLLAMRWDFQTCLVVVATSRNFYFMYPEYDDEMPVLALQSCLRPDELTWGRGGVP